MGNTFIEIYIDGACRDNQNKHNIGAWGAILSYQGKKKYFGDVHDDVTNNIMELTAAICGLSKIKHKEIPVKVYSDSQYVVSGIVDWSKKWKVNGFQNSKKKEIENKGLWIWLLDLVAQFKDIEFIKVEGHSGNNGNEQVDRYINELMDNYKK
jgi:ribonuclease HI